MHDELELGFDKARYQTVSVFAVIIGGWQIIVLRLCAEKVANDIIEFRSLIYLDAIWQHTSASACHTGDELVEVGRC